MPSRERKINMNSNHSNKDIIEEHLEWVRRLARSILRDNDGADEVVQEAWIRASKSPPRRGPSERAWLARVVRNLASDRRRAEARRRDHETVAARKSLIDEGARPGESQKQREMIERWVHELRAPYRATMLRHWLEDVPVAVIAAADGVPEATVRTRLRRGAALVRERAELESGGHGMQWLAVVAQAPGVKLLGARGAAVGVTALSSLVWRGSPITKFLKLAAALALVGMASRAVLLSPPPTLGPVEVDDGGVAAVENTELVAVTPQTPRLDLAADAKREPMAGRVAVAGLFDRERPLVTLKFPAAAEVALPRRPRIPSIAIRVSKSNGQPIVDAPVALFDAARTVMQGITDANGQATFRHIAERLGPRRPSSLSVGLRSAIGESGRVKVLLAAVPEDPIAVTAPEFGSLLVKVIGSDGEPFPFEGTVWSYPVELRSGRKPTRVGEGEQIQVGPEREALFPIVGIGVAREIRLNGRKRYRAGSAIIEGVTSAETAVVTVEIGPPCPTVVGRVTDEEGRPLRDARLEFESGDRSATTRADADGVFQMAFRYRLDPGVVLDGTLLAEIVDAVSVSGETHFSVPLRIHVPHGEATTDVGVLAMKPSQVLVAGHAVTPEGERLERAIIQLLYWRENELTGFGRWDSMPNGQTQSDSEGAFQIPGTAPEADLGILASQDGLTWGTPVMVPVNAYDKEVRLVLERTQLLRGQVMLPDGCNFSDLEIHARWAGAGRGITGLQSSRRTTLNSNGSFEIAGIPSVPMRVELHGAGRDPIRVSDVYIEDVMPHSADEQPPASLNPWDLRPTLTYVEIDITDLAGESVPQAVCVVGATRLETGSTPLRGLVPIASGKKALVVSPGFQPTYFSLTSGRSEVKLQRGITVAIQLSRAVPDLPEGWELKLCLRPSAETLDWMPEHRYAASSYYAEPVNRTRLQRNWMEQKVVTQGATSVTLHAPSHGQYRAFWLLRRSLDPRPAHGRYEKTIKYEGNTFDLVIPKGDAAVDYAFHWDGAAFETAVAYLR